MCRRAIISASESATTALGETTVSPTTGGPALPQCPVDNDPPIFEAGVPIDERSFDFDTICPADVFSDIAALPNTNVDLRITGPATPFVEARPLIVFQHGSGLNWEAYPELIEEINKAGFIVANLYNNESTPDPRIRGELFACVHRYMTTSWPLRNDYLDGRIGYVGHSSSGAGVVFGQGFVNNAINNGLLGFGNSELLAIVSIAPGALEDPLDNQQTPHLIIQGTYDNDTTGQLIRLVDMQRQDSPPFLEKSNLAAIWAYRVQHSEYGGEGLGLKNTDKGIALASTYASGFLRWHILDEFSNRSLFTGDAPPPDGVSSPDFWEDNEGNPISPRIFQQFVVDTTFPGAARTLIDDFNNNDVLVPAIDGVVEFGPGPVPLEGSIASFNDPYSKKNLSNGLRFDVPAGSNRFLRWVLNSVPDLTGYSYLSFRLGQRFSRLDLQGCETTQKQVENLTVRLSDGNNEAEVHIDLLGENPVAEVPVQDYGPPTWPNEAPFPDWATENCHAYDYIRTVRVPLASVCEEIDITDLESVEIDISAQNDMPLELTFANVELSRSPFDQAESCGPVCLDP